MMLDLIKLTTIGKRPIYFSGGAYDDEDFFVDEKTICN